MRKVPVLIVGAGVSGLSVAYHLPCNHLLIEKESKAGGLARSVHSKGFTFDHSGHLLHFHNDDTTALIRSLVKGGLKRCKRSAWIYSHEVCTPYPYQVNTYQLPERIKEECIDGLSEALDKLKVKTNPRQSFLEWVVSRFGMGFAKNFFLPYNRKLWTVDPSVLTSEWVDSFVPQPSIEEVIKGATTDYSKSFGYNSYFYYPKTGGIEKLVQGFFHKDSINLECNTTLHSVRCSDHVVTIRKMNGELEEVEYDYLVFTIPLPEFLKRVSDLSPKLSGMREKLRWTTVVCVNVGTSEKNSGNGAHWIYFPESKFPFYRIGFPSNFSSDVTPKGCSSMYVEVSVPGSSIVTKDKLTDIVFRCTDGLKECGLLKSTDHLVTVKPLVIPYGYVIYDRNRTPAVTTCLSELNASGIYGIGRYGGWKYSFMEADIGEAKRLAFDLSDGKNLQKLFRADSQRS